VSCLLLERLVMPARSVAMSRLRLRTLLGSSCLLATATAAHAQPVFLSDLMGSPSGTATCLDFPPFMIVTACSTYGLGVNCPGNFAATPIQFSDAGPFARGIGMHPPPSGAAIVRFDLDAIRALNGREPLMLTTRVGIDIPSGGGANGAIFTMRIDDVMARMIAVPNGSASVPVELDTEAVRFIDLQTEHLGGFNANHAAFADVQLVLGPECPAPALIAGLPAPDGTCPIGSATFTVDARYWGPFTFQWEREVSPGSGVFVALNDGLTTWDGGAPGIGAIVLGATTGNLSILPNLVLGRRLGPPHAIRYRCVVTNTCGSTVSDAAQLTVSCRTDLTCDGFVNSQDFFDFLTAFFALGPLADFNIDGFINSQDFFDFLNDFFNPC
jgi:hypothetical protein